MVRYMDRFPTNADLERKELEKMPLRYGDIIRDWNHFLKGALAVLARIDGHFSEDDKDFIDSTTVALMAFVDVQCGYWYAIFKGDRSMPYERLARMRDLGRDPRVTALASRAWVAGRPPGFRAVGDRTDAERARTMIERWDAVKVKVNLAEALTLITPQEAKAVREQLRAMATLVCDRFGVSGTGTAPLLEAGIRKVLGWGR